MTKKFKLYWLTNKTEIIEGPSIEAAFAMAGYGGGVIRALDYYKEIKLSQNASNKPLNPNLQQR